MKKIGLTGGIGSGKTYVGAIFAALGVPIFDSDKEAKLAYQDDSIKLKIIHLLGSKAYLGSEPNFPFVAALIFKDKKLLTSLNEIIHPWVEKRFIQWADNMSAFKYIIKEAAILHESGSYQDLDATICVYAQDSIRIDRVLKRDNIEIEQVKSRLNNQWPQDKKIALSEYLINNDGTKLVLPQVLEIHRQIIS